MSFSKRLLAQRGMQKPCLTTRWVSTKVSSHEDLASQINNAKTNKKLVVVDWTAGWCQPCKFISPHFEQLSEDYPDVTFLKVDVDELPDLARQAAISAMPTFHFIKDGQKVEELRGANVDQLKALVEGLSEV